mmetsp:Transcript_2663/g.3676  ORF Transcript_2663/g.3676 Transcript_2663/m.3676 type:complete len:92 (+) Transcript_2663:3-278(+)
MRKWSLRETSDERPRLETNMNESWNELNTINKIYKHLQKEIHVLSEFSSSSSLSRTKWETLNLVLQDVLQVMKKMSDLPSENDTKKVRVSN